MPAETAARTPDTCSSSAGKYAANGASKKTTLAIDRIAASVPRDAAENAFEQERDRDADQDSAGGDDDERHRRTRERERSDDRRGECKAVQDQRRRIVDQTLAANDRGDAPRDGDPFEDRLGSDGVGRRNDRSRA